MSCWAVAVTALVVSGLLQTSTGEAQETEPRATLSSQAVAIGKTIEVIGVGWQPGSLVVVELCGNGATGGSLDCVAAGRETGVGSEGTFRMSLTATAPPRPCPCVVAVSAVPGADRTLVPLEIEGVPQAPLDEQRAPAPRLVVDARLEGSGPWTAWFGASGERTLVLTVRNTGTAPADMRLALAVGSGDTADAAIDVDDPGRLEPGASRTLRIPVRFDALALGRHVVAGEIAAPGTAAPFEIRTSVHPWGVYGAVLLGFVALVAVGLRRIRRRVRPSRAGGGPASSNGSRPTPVAPAPAPVAAHAMNGPVVPPQGSGKIQWLAPDTSALAPPATNRDDRDRPPVIRWRAEGEARVELTGTDR